MRGLIKFTLLAFFFCLNLFSFDFPEDSLNPRMGFLPYGVSASQVSDVEFLNGTYLKIGNDIYTYNSIYDSVFNLELLKDSGYMLENNPKDSVRDLYYYDSSFSKITVICQKVDSGYLGCSKHDYDDQFGKDPTFKKVDFSYYKLYSVSPVGSCQSDEHFNTQTQQCQKCKENESWDPETNTCYKDCNKEGKPNKLALTDGRCIDCSGEKDPMSALKCLCGGLGHGSGFSFSKKNQYDPSASSCSLVGYCSDGFQIATFTDPSCNPDNKPEKPKPDDNKTKPDDPKPNPDPGGSNGGGNSGGGNNPGGSEDKPNPDSGNNDEFCKKNPKDPKCKNNDNNSTTPGPGGGNNNGGNAKFNEGDFNSDNLKKEMGDFEKAYKGAFSEIQKNFEGAEGLNSFKNGIDQFINNLKGKGLNDISKKSMPKSCSHKETIDFFGYNVVMDFDFCKIVEPASDAFYYLFYVFFFGCFLFLIIKFLIFSF